MIDAPVTVTANWIPARTITFSVLGGNGNLTAQHVAGASISSGTAVPDGSNLLFTAIANSNFEVAEWLVNGAPVGHTNLTHTISALGANVNVQVRFEEIPTPPTIQTPALLPSGMYGMAYSQTLTAAGTGTITWSVTSPGDLPDGLTLSSSGVISGTPTVSATFQVYTFVVTATSPHGTDTRTFSLEILDPDGTIPPPVITTTSPLPSGVFGVVYSEQINATGFGPFEWTVSSGVFPGLMNLAPAAGRIS